MGNRYTKGPKHGRSARPLPVRLSDEERAALERYAAASGLSLGEHLRRYGVNPAPAR